MKRSRVTSETRRVYSLAMVLRLCPREWDKWQGDIDAMTGESDQSKRAEKRDSLFLSATVSIEKAPAFSTRVRNLSAGGMMIDAPHELSPGTAVAAEMRGIGNVAGRVAWFSLGRAGIAFDKDIDPRLARTSGPPKSEIPVHFRPDVGRRPGLAVR